MKPAVLAIKSEVPGVVVSVYDSDMGRVEEGVAPFEVSLDAGLYLVKVAGAPRAYLAQQHLVELKAERRYILQLGGEREGLTEDTSQATTRAIAPVLGAFKTLFAQASAPARRETDEPPVPIWIRFLRLEGWNKAQLVTPQTLEAHFKDGALIIKAEIPERSVVFAQAMVEGQLPLTLNTALPGGGWLRAGTSTLVLRFIDGRLHSEAHLGDQQADAAAQYLRRGNFEAAKQVVHTFQAPTSSRLGYVFASVTAHIKDPARSAIARYSLLRAGELDWLKDLPDNLIDVFDWLADGYVISAELMARAGHARQALVKLTQLPQGCLPLFTDGFSMLVSRLHQFTQTKPAPRDTTQAEIEKGNALLDSLRAWAPYLDMRALTLTFVGADLTNPARSVDPESFDSRQGWQKASDLATKWSQPPVQPALRGSTLTMSRRNVTVKKRLVICCDGTWNTPDEIKDGQPCPTNVAKLALAVVTPLDTQGIEQRVYYHKGVGSNTFDHFRGEALGWGLSRNVQDAYMFLVENYDDPGDEIFLFGFSRGAYTARSVVGLVRNAGLLKREYAGKLDVAYELYRDRTNTTHSRSVEATLFRKSFAREVRIKCLGVWETVGPLGIPVDFPGVHLINDRWKFHDVQPSIIVDNAFQALAVDEHRKPFTPTIWQQQPGAAQAGQRLEQVWFAGVHSDVGGGYPETGLSDITLAWMAARATQCGLALDFKAANIHMMPQPDGPLHDSMTWYYRLLGPLVRSISVQRYDDDGRPVITNEKAADMAILRLQNSSYQPSNLIYFYNNGGPQVNVGVRVHRDSQGEPIPSL